MALQLDVEKVSVVDAGLEFGGKLLNVTINLKCWAEGVDTEITDPVIDQNFTSQYSEIPGLTIVQRLTITYNDILAKMQETIDRYKREQALLENVLLDSVVTNLTAALVG